MKIIDLTQPLTEKIPVYPGTPEKPPYFEQLTSVACNGYCSYRLTCDMHVGTHIDAPAHFIANGKRISDTPIERFCGTAHLLDARNHTSIDGDLLKQIELKPNDILLVWTGWDKQYGTPDYFTKHPIVTHEFAQTIINHHISMIGLDTPSPDYYPFAIHKLLLQHEILIIENLTNLEHLKQALSIELYALPLKCTTDGAVARVVAHI